jgi:hypothetical protein
MTILEKAKSAFDKGIKFNTDCLSVLPSSLLPADENNETNCINYVLWAGGLFIEHYPYPRIDFIYKNWNRTQDPQVGNIIAYPSSTKGKGSWLIFMPGCIAIISEVNAKKATKVVIAHPKVDGIIGETEMELFKDRDFVYLEFP